MATTSALLSTYLTCLFLALSLTRTAGQSCTCTFFSYDFSDWKELIFEGDARINGMVVDLTPEGPTKNDLVNKVGRASYSDPIPLVNEATGAVTSFTTSFSFAIKNFPAGSSSASRGDGFTFFLAHFPSDLGSTADTAGGQLGLIHGGLTSSGNASIVAVEFDTHHNTWDPANSVDHIGIDANSLASVEYTVLPTGGLQGIMTANVAYDGMAKTLTVTLYDNKGDAYSVVAMDFDLKQLLPFTEVAVGFSASTGSSVELNQLINWTFSSTLPS